MVCIPAGIECIPYRVFDSKGCPGEFDKNKKATVCFFNVQSLNSKKKMLLFYGRLPHALRHRANI